MKEVRDIYSYCGDTGLIKKIKTGEVVDGKHTKGYVSAGRYLAHRVAWFLYYGEIPNGQIDHINQDKKDNRIKNLRCVSNMDNHRNMPIQKNNTTGIVGVHFIKHKKRWVSYIKVDSKRFHLGTFDNLFDACCKRRSQEVYFGFHANHGRSL